MLIALVIAVVLLGVGANFILRSKKPAVVEPDPTVDYRQLLAENIPYYGRLNVDLQHRFEQKVSGFLAEVRIEAVGFELTDADRIRVAASAVIPILNFDDWNYPNLTNVILYPDTFNNDFQFEGENRNIAGMVGSGFMNGQMLLSRAALIKGFSRDSGKQNTGIHEFVHLLDDTDGATDGIPENLIEHNSTVPWLKMIHNEMRRIKAGNSDIDPYALTSEAEFLAVAAEYFFEKPEQLSKKHPELYAVLAGMFNQNPAKQ